MLFGNVDARPLFGGYGVYKEGLIFGSVINETFYLKADDANRGQFNALGLQPLIYESNPTGKQVSVGCYGFPKDALESETQMLQWAQSAHAAVVVWR